jgi:hypothetical protein
LGEGLEEGEGGEEGGASASLFRMVCLVALLGVVRLVSLVGGVEFELCGRRVGIEWRVRLDSI